MSRKFILSFFTFLLLSATLLQAQTARKFTIPLTEDGAANMVVFLPQKPTGKAIVGIPGGGYSVLSNGQEGYEWSGWLNERGIAYCVVNYRLPNGDRTLPISDVEKGISIVRDSASVWSIHPRDVGIMGFSAGGHLASVISTLSPYELRPDFSILFYPVISMNERESHVYSCRNFLGEEGQKDPELVRKYSTNNSVQRHLTPPAIVLLSSDDRLVPPLTNGLAYYTAMRRAGNDCALYVYPSGGHGYGIGSWFQFHDQMLQELGNWLDAHPAPPVDAVRVACIGNSITDGHGIDLATLNGYPAQLQRLLGSGYWVKNFGVSARTLLNEGDYPYMKETAWRDALAFHPDVVVIKLGTNDSKPQNWKHHEAFEADLRQMLTQLNPSLGKKATKRSKKSSATQTAQPRIYLCTPIPAIKSTWEISDSVIVNGIIPIIQKVAKEYGLPLIDLHTLYANDSDKMLTDGIHPDERGARRIAQIVADALKQ